MIMANFLSVYSQIQLNGGTITGIMAYDFGFSRMDSFCEMKVNKRHRLALLHIPGEFPWNSQGTGKFP